MSPVLTAFAYGFLVVLALFMLILLWAGWASRGMDYYEDGEL